jgi:hypothetical protein
MVFGIHVTTYRPFETYYYSLFPIERGILTCVVSFPLFSLEDKLKIVLGQKLNGLEKFVQYYGLAVVEKNSTIKLTELKGVKSCHTGVNRTVGWKIPVGYLLYTKEMDYTKDQYTSASAFFGDSCAPGMIIFLLHMTS